jgi:hypothetical protein
VGHANTVLNLAVRARRRAASQLGPRLCTGGCQLYDMSTLLITLIKPLEARTVVFVMCAVVDVGGDRRGH